MSWCTIVTLSKEPTTRSDIPKGFAYLNPTQSFDDVDGFNHYWKKALAQVKTPYCSFVDSDDPMPEGKWTCGFRGAAFGMDYINGKLVEPRQFRYKGGPFNHLDFHKSILNTQDAQRLLPFIPDGEYLPDMMVHALCLGLWGLNFEPKWFTHWNPGQHHKLSGKARINTTKAIAKAFLDAEKAILGKERFKQVEYRYFK